MNRRFQGVVETLDDLLARCRQNPRLAVLMAVELRDLQETLDRLRDAKSFQIALESARQLATRDCNRLGAHAQDLAMRIRSGVTHVLGRRNPKVREFGIAPLRDTKNAPV